MIKQTLAERKGLLLVDVPESSFWRYTILEYSKGTWSTYHTNNRERAICVAHKCTKEEAKKYPQFRWVALEDLY